MDRLVVKRKGHLEPFDPKKLYASIYAACMSLRTHEGECELIAEKVTHEVMTILQHHPQKQVNAKEIFDLALSWLKVLNPDAAYMYEHHFDIC